VAYKFIKEQDHTNQFDKSEIIFTVDTVTCSDLCEEFRYFLLSCGYHPDTVNACFNIEEE
jgi:hypothetical protein